MKRILRLAAGLAAAFTAAGLLPCLKSCAAPPETSAGAYVLTDAQSGQIICGMHADEKRPMASTTKIMTTLLTLESGDLDTPFPADSEAICVEGSSMGLQAGDTVTKRVLCAGMLLPSGNDAANAAAVAVAGSIPDFLRLMNSRAEKIGMTHSCFASPSGLDADGHGASAADMALLAREALQNDDFAAICRQQRMTVCFGNPPCARTLTNTNKLLAMDETVIGIKTGFTDAAGRCLVSACRRDGRTLICVTLSDRNDWNDHLALYDYAFPLAEPYSVPAPRLPELPVEGGTVQAVPVYLPEPLQLTAWRGIPPECDMTVLLPPFLTAPIEKGTQVGTLLCSRGKTEIARLPLCASVKVEQQVPKKPAGNMILRIKKAFFKCFSKYRQYSLCHFIQ